MIVVRCFAHFSRFYPPHACKRQHMSMCLGLGDGNAKVERNVSNHPAATRGLVKPEARHHLVVPKGRCFKECHNSSIGLNSTMENIDDHPSSSIGPESVSIVVHGSSGVHGWLFGLLKGGYPLII